MRSIKERCHGKQKGEKSRCSKNLSFRKGDLETVYIPTACKVIMVKFEALCAGHEANQQCVKEPPSPPPKKDRTEEMKLV